jgi:hypothetical protein
VQGSTDGEVSRIEDSSKEDDDVHDDLLFSYGSGSLFDEADGTESWR